jgi:hypothetical protein
VRVKGKISLKYLHAHVQEVKSAKKQRINQKGACEEKTRVGLL